MQRLAILISGSGTNMEAIVHNTQPGGMLEGLCQVAVVISNKPNALGLEKAKALGIPVICVPSAGRSREDFENDLLDVLKEHQPELIVLAGFMRVLSPVMTNAYKNQIINIHPADTRAFQGVGGYRWAYENGLKQTHITVHYIDEGVDTGPIIDQMSVDIEQCKNVEEVTQVGLAAERLFYSKVIRNLLVKELKKEVLCAGS